MLFPMMSSQHMLREHVLNLQSVPRPESDALAPIPEYILIIGVRRDSPAA